MLNAIGTILILIIALVWVLRDYEDKMTDGQGAMIKALIDFFKSHAQYFLYWMFALWGGTSSYLMELNSSNGDFSVKSWIGRMVVSGFAGILMVMLCNSLGLPLSVIGLSAGIGGYMGGSAILMVQKMIVKRVQS